MSDQQDFRTQQDSPMQIVCMNWGDAYGPDYVNRLYSMIARSAVRPFRLVCYTDSDRGIRSEVECFPCPEVDIDSPKRNRGWRKLSLWNRQLPGLSGTVLFLDLDIAITGVIDDFFSYRPDADFCVIHNWTHPDLAVGNTSVYRFETGSHPEILTEFLIDYRGILQQFRNSQTYISDCLKDSIVFWPEEWCRSFKRHCVPRGIQRWFREPQLPTGARVVAFPGRPNPHEAVAGHWPCPWYKRFYKHVRPATWLREVWQ
ncbi:MAG: hypothetical protein KDA85_13750 [Planctomycetaceae bacterium]|nr:hypothetical protein [Planctomycetaceae bacterium]